MKKHLKRFLVLTQVLGLSALAATACTDNNKHTTSSSATLKQKENPSVELQASIIPNVSHKNYHKKLKKDLIKAGDIIAKTAIDSTAAAATIVESIDHPLSTPHNIITNTKLAKDANKVVDHVRDKLNERVDQEPDYVPDATKDHHRIKNGLKHLGEKITEDETKLKDKVVGHKDKP